MVAFGNLVGLLLAAEAAVARSRRHGKNGKYNQFSYDNSSWWNALSPLGTNKSPHLPPWFTNNPMPEGKPWGGRTSWNTNYYKDTPNTGVTRYYDWTVSKIPCALDGVNVTCLAVNNQVPGPLIEANWGDWFEITVKNDIADEGTAIHWHGLLQKGTPEQDGVPGIDQCPIAPGSTFTYRFQADLYGTSWYHSHYSEQYGSGMFGPIVIYGPDHTECDVDLGPVMVGDWYHQYWEEVVDALFQPLPAANIPRSDNNLINGKNDFDCKSTTLPCTPNAPLSSFNFTSGKTYKMRLINPSAAAVEKITLDGHTFTIIANDFVEVEPYETDVVTLAVGQRTDVLIKATGRPGDSYWLRGYKPPPCWPTNGGNEALAAVFYQGADTSQPPSSSPGPNAYNEDCHNDPLSATAPVYPITLQEPDMTEIVPLEFKSNGTNLLWYMANRTFVVDYNTPILAGVKNGQTIFPYLSNVHNYGNKNSIRMVLENQTPQPHPMHLHGHNLYVLAEGDCGTPANGTGGPPGGSGPSGPSKRQTSQYGHCWDGTIVNPSNPQRRDVQMLTAYSYLVIQWDQDNPGVWPLHCHIAWHLSAGFVWNVLEQPSDVQNMAAISSTIPQTCNDWAAWTNDHTVDQVGDGM